MATWTSNYCMNQLKRGHILRHKGSSFISSLYSRSSARVRERATERMVSVSVGHVGESLLPGGVHLGPFTDLLTLTYTHLSSLEGEVPGRQVDVHPGRLHA